MAPITEDGKGEGGGDRVWPFFEGEWGRRRGGSMVPKADNTVKSGAAAGGWRSKMTKGNWVGGPNARLSRTADYAGEKNMAESMR
jgi:hypothetical protein